MEKNISFDLGGVQMNLELPTLANPLSKLTPNLGFAEKHIFDCLTMFYIDVLFKKCKVI